MARRASPVMRQRLLAGDGAPDGGVTKRRARTVAGFASHLPAASRAALGAAFVAASLPVAALAQSASDPAPVPRPAVTEPAGPGTRNAPVPRPVTGIAESPSGLPEGAPQNGTLPTSPAPVSPSGTTTASESAPPVGGPVPPAASVPADGPAPVAPVVPGIVQPTPPLRVAPQDRAVSAATSLRQAVLTVDQEAMYRQSRWGQRATAELARQSRQVADDNDRAFAALVADEDALTAARPGLTPEEFRRRAAAFDERVTAVRQERDAAREALQVGADRERALFFQSAAPVMGSVMAARGALVVLDQRTVLISDQAIDATAAIIAALDAELGDGSQIVAAATQAQAAQAEEGTVGAEDTPAPPETDAPADPQGTEDAAPPDTAPPGPAGSQP